MLSTADKIKQIVYDCVCVDMPWDMIRLDHNLEDDLFADSIDKVSIIMGIEEEFEVDILDSEMDEIETVGDLVDHVTKALKVAA